MPREDSEDPVTIWIDGLRTADRDAAQKLWNHFVSRLYELGRRQLRHETRRVYDEEDAALSAFNSVFAGIREGRFPDLQNRDNLWRLLVVITARKAAHRQRYDRQQRRDVRRQISCSLQVDSDFLQLDALPSHEPTAEFAAEFLETCEQLMLDLDDPTLWQVVTLRMEGYEDSEIARQLNCSRRTVQRRLEIIRRKLDPAGTLQ